jgi:DNA-binding NtrC family response regulator
LEADGGTLFLDEIGDLRHELQTKLLRAIQEKVIRPVGFDHDVPVDPRIICATNKDLRERCKTNEFREDLYYRLVTVVLTVPPLRERKEDIVPLARHFVGLASKWLRTLTPEAEERLLQYDWPGNVRELRSAMEQAVIFAMANEIQANELEFLGTTKADRASQSLADVEQHYILRVLKDCNGNRTDTARVLGLSRSTLLLKLKYYETCAGK